MDLPGGAWLMADMDVLTAFGLFAVSGMLLCYAFDERSPWWVLGFAGFCLLGSIYGFLQGAWPFGLVEGAWTAIALRRWWQRRRHASGISHPL
jgi:hypothetical protein